MKYQSSEIAITGGSGGLGLYMPKGVVNLKTRLESSYAEKMSEMKNYKTDVKVLVHLAALASVRDCESNPELAYKLNVLGSIDWFRVSQELGLEKFIFISTSHVYSKDAQNPIGVSDHCDPQTIYAKTKLEAEKSLLGLESEGATELNIARVFSILSEKGRDWALLQGLRRRAQTSDFSEIPGLNEVRDFLWADQVCEQIIFHVNSNEKKKLVNICSGQGIAIREIAGIIFKNHGLDFSKLEQSNNEKNTFRSIIGKQSYPKTYDIKTRLNDFK